MNSPKIYKPIIKWVGGKTQILDKLLTEFPKEMNNYHELFLGGGSVLFALLSHMRSGAISVRGQVFAYDANEPLIYLYKNIQSSPTEVFAEIQRIINDYNESPAAGIVNRAPANITEAKITKENYYYWIRSEYNKLSPADKKTVLGSAFFIFLNKTCFRGLFRVGPRGFNVPYGHYTNPEIVNKDHLDEIHGLIQGVVFNVCDFSASIAKAVSDDFVYLDPPYAPETETSFVGYTENGFNTDNHIALFNSVHKLSAQGTKIMMSNADVKLVRDNFTTENYKTASILCKRSINSKKPESKTNEVIIKNY